MTDPKYAQNIPGRGRWYFHPQTGEQWPSITNVLDTSVSKPALVPWAAKVTAEKALRDIPRTLASLRQPRCNAKRVADRCGKCTPCMLAEIKAEPKIVKDKAADLGSRVHAIQEAKAKGYPVPDDPEAAPFAEQADRFFADFGIDLEQDVEAAEATVINRTLGYAGTGDLWVWITIDGVRRLCLVDYKTSSTRAATSVYTEYGQQLAALRFAESFLLDDGTEIEPPGPIDATAILNLRVDSYALVPMPVGGDIDAAFDAFVGALANARYHHAQYGAKALPMTPPTTTRKAA